MSRKKRPIAYKCCDTRSCSENRVSQKLDYYLYDIIFICIVYLFIEYVPWTRKSNPFSKYKISSKCDTKLI